MSIENNIERIALALETLVSKLDHIGQVVNEPVQPAIAKPGHSSTICKVEDVPKQPITPPSPPAKPVEASTPVVAPPSAVTTASMTAEQLNALLVSEFNRLGSRDPIVKIMAAPPFNAVSITDLTPVQYQPLVDAVRAAKV